MFPGSFWCVCGTNNVHFHSLLFSIDYEVSIICFFAVSLHSSLYCWKHFELCTTYFMMAEVFIYGKIIGLDFPQAHQQPHRRAKCNKKYHLSAIGGLPGNEEMLRIEPRTSYMQGMCFTTELHPHVFKQHSL